MKMVVKDHECKVRDQGYLPPSEASTAALVAAWAEHHCPSRTFTWSPENWDKGGAFCCLSRDDPGHANPTWNIYQVPEALPLLKSATSVGMKMVVKDHECKVR